MTKSLMELYIVGTYKKIMEPQQTSQNHHGTSQFLMKPLHNLSFVEPSWNLKHCETMAEPQKSMYMGHNLTDKQFNVNLQHSEILFYLPMSLCNHAFDQCPLPASPTYVYSLPSDNFHHRNFILAYICPWYMHIKYFDQSDLYFTNGSYFS